MTTLVLPILNGSSSFLHTIRTTIEAWMSLNFGKMPLLILLRYSVLFTVESLSLLYLLVIS